MIKILHIILGIITLIFISGCAKQQLTNKGYIENINNLSTVKTSKIEKHKKIQEFVIADAQYRSFEYINIAPIKFVLPKDVDKKVKRKDKKKLSDYFDASLRKKLAGYPILDKPNSFQPKTYLVETFVTDINGSNALLNFVLTATVALPFDTGGITVESRIIDTDTGEEVAAFRGFREGTMFHIVGGMTKYGHAEGGLDLYTKEIKTLLDNFQCPNCVEVIIKKAPPKENG